MLEAAAALVAVSRSRSSSTAKHSPSDGSRRPPEATSLRSQALISAAAMSHVSVGLPLRQRRRLNVPSGKNSERHMVAKAKDHSAESGLLTCSSASAKSGLGLWCFTWCAAPTKGPERTYSPILHWPTVRARSQTACHEFDATCACHEFDAVPDNESCGNALLPCEALGSAVLFCIAAPACNILANLSQALVGRGGANPSPGILFYRLGVQFYRSKVSFFMLGV